MKKTIHTIALYTATILISSLPFAIDTADANDKIKKQRITVVRTIEDATLEQRKKIEHK